jgi:hypothetical protein
LAGTFVDQFRLIVDGYSDALHKRMANDPTFIASSFNLSGVARSANNRWGTLVAPGVALSARHFRPSTGHTMTFFESNDPSGNSETRTVIGGVRIAGSDLWLSILDEPLPPAYEPLAFIDEPVTTEAGFGNSSIGNAPVYMVGRSDTVNSSVTNMAVGRNILDYWIDSVSDGATTDHAIVAIQHLPGDQDFVTHEAFLETYDSGAPLLMDVGGTLTIIGINWFILVDGDQDTRIDIKPGPQQQLRNASGFSYVGNYAPEIQGVLDAFAVQATQAYIGWMGSAFGGVTDWAQTGPAIDFDGDGLNNFMEYAFALNPAGGAAPSPVSAAAAEDGGQQFLEAVLKVRDDPDLSYSVALGSDLLGWTGVPLAFGGGVWSSTVPGVAVVASQANMGGGVWQLSVRAAVPLVAGEPRFLKVGVE